MISRIKEVLINNLKHLPGWKTKRKILVFSVDDYGNVRLHSAEARRKLDEAGLQIYSRFDQYDALETKQDLEQLYNVLESVKDKNGRSAVFTVFSLPCNIDFDRMKSESYTKYYFELLPDTYRKLATEQPQAYTGAWEFWQQGIQKGLLKPQFHGREHLNLFVLEDKLNKKDSALLTALENKSYTSISDEEYSSMSSTAAFDFRDQSDLNRLQPVIEEGLNCFEKVFGFRSNYFTPPVYQIHHKLFPVLLENGIRYIDLGLVRKEHQGNGVYKTSLNYIGKSTPEGLTVMVRNVVFEPTEDRGLDWVDFTMKQIERAFRWNKPAIISSHRVNFCGHIDPENRSKGLSSLQSLLKEIVRKWPDVEFMSADELADSVVGKK